MKDRDFHLIVHHHAPCCLVDKGIIHWASAYLGDEGRCLTTYVEYNNNPVHVLQQSGLDDVTLWRDKRSLGLPICSICEAAFNEEQNVLDAWRS